VDGCGISLEEEGGSFVILSTRAIKISHNNFKALIHFTNSGYKL